MKKKTYYSIIILLILNISIISSQVLKSYDTKYQDFITKYGRYDISDKISKDNVAEYYLDYYDNSIINAWAEGSVVLYKDNYKLFSDTEFYDINGIKNNFNAIVYIWTTEILNEVIPRYEDNCDELELENKSIVLSNCKKVKVKDEVVSYPVSYWKQYNQELLKSGTYKWRLEAKRPINKKIDFVLIEGISNTKLDKWAWWDESWLRKKKINITYTNPTPSYNYSILINITYDSDMMSNFSDIRFTNFSENEEFNYYIEQKVDSDYALVYVKIPELTKNTSIYMYYKNPVASTTSNFNTAFLYADDFETNTNSSYNAYTCTGRTNVENGVYNITLADANYLCSQSPKSTLQRSLNNYTVEINRSFISYTNGYSGLVGLSSAGNPDDDGVYTLKHMSPAQSYNQINRGWPGVTAIATSALNVDLGGVFYQNATFRANGTTTSCVYNSTTTMRCFSGTDTTYTSGYYGLTAYNFPMTQNVYWFRVLAYSSIPVTYNVGVEEVNDQKPFVNLTTPVNNTEVMTYSTYNINFNCSGTDDIAILNLSLYINGILNLTVTNSSPEQLYLNLQQSYDLGINQYNYSCIAFDSLNQQSTDKTNFFNVSLAEASILTHKDMVLGYDIDNSNVINEYQLRLCYNYEKDYFNENNEMEVNYKT